MKKILKLFCFALVVASSSCQKTDTLDTSPDRASPTAALNKAIPNNPILITKLMDALSENVYEQFETREFRISSVSDDQFVDGLHMYNVEYTTSQEQRGSAILVLDR